MAQLVAENILAIDTKFWMRLATRNDTAGSREDKERLQVGWRGMCITQGGGHVY